MADGVPALQLRDSTSGILEAHGLSLIDAFGARPIYRLRLVGSTDIGAKDKAGWEAAVKPLLAETPVTASAAN